MLIGTQTAKFLGRLLPSVKKPEERQHSDSWMAHRVTGSAAGVRSLSRLVHLFRGPVDVPRDVGSSPIAVACGVQGARRKKFYITTESSQV